MARANGYSHQLTSLFTPLIRPLHRSLGTATLATGDVGDQGMVKFSEALGKGALASLEMLFVDDAEHPALQAACKARGIELP